MKDLKLYHGEYRFMTLIWDNQPINSTKLHKLCLQELGWKKSTTYTMIRKLSEKNLIQNENATVTALVKKEEVKKYESETVVDRMFDSSLPQFITAFLKGKKLSKEEADDIKKIIEEASE